MHLTDDGRTGKAKSVKIKRIHKQTFPFVAKCHPLRGLQWLLPGSHLTTSEADVCLADGHSAAGCSRARDRPPDYNSIVGHSSHQQQALITLRTDALYHLMPFKIRFEKQKRLNVASLHPNARHAPGSAIIVMVLGYLDERVVSHANRP